MRLTTSCLAALAFAIVLHSGNALGADYDLVVANGRVVDGTGAPWFRADVGVRGDRIDAIGDLSAATAERRIDLAGRIVAPGFIDMLLLGEVRETFQREPPGTIQLASCVNPTLKPYMGRRLDEVAREMKKPPEEALLEIVEADRGQGWAVRFWMNEEDVRLAIRQPWVSFVTDNPGQATDSRRRSGTRRA